MGSKVAAVLMSVVLLSLSLAGVACSSDGSSGEAGSIGNPVFLSSSAEDSRILVVGQSMTVYFGINWGSFFNPKVTIESWACTDPEAEEPASVLKLMELDRGLSAQDYGNGVTVSAVKRTDDSGSNGIYALIFTAPNSLVDQPYYDCYKLKVTVQDTVASMSHYTQHYYYAVNMKVVEIGHSVLVKDTDGSYKTSLRLERDTPYQSAVKISDTAFDKDNYDFYAHGLPDGFNMRLDGVIEGLASGSLLASSPEGDAIVYAISKMDATMVYSGTIHYYLQPGDSFQYKVTAGGSQTFSCFEEGHVAVVNTQPITVKIMEVGDTYDRSNYVVTLTLDGSIQMIDFTGDSFVLNGQPDFSGYTGVLQLQITKTVGSEVYFATLHILVTGPIVHSGLQPAVTSA